MSDIDQIMRELRNPPAKVSPHGNHAAEADITPGRE